LIFDQWFGSFGRVIMKIRYRILMVAAFVVLLLLVRFVADIGYDRAPDERFRIVDIIDGDTVKLPGDRLRLIGIDCPEKGEPYYDSAICFMEAVGLNKTAKVSYSNRQRDKYGRMLGYVVIDDSLFLNAELVRRGLANVYLFSDNIADSGNVAALIEAQNEAMDDGVGIWSIQRSPEPFYVAGKKSYRFHRPGCPSAKKYNPDTWLRFETREEACRLGFSPCRNCKP